MMGLLPLSFVIIYGANPVVSFMKVVFVNKSDTKGGAAVVTFRLMMALRRAGVDARMLVCEKNSDSEFVELIASRARMKYSFLAERLQIFLTNGFSRKNLFKIDTATSGVDISRNPLIEQADVVCLNWVNQGMLSLKDIERIKQPIVWTMHDMWCMTGVCHHAGRCKHYRNVCGRCKYYKWMSTQFDPSFKVLKKKECLYDKKDIHFVAVSNWLAQRAKESRLLKNGKLSVIPNAFPLSAKEAAEVNELRCMREERRKIVLLMGAARLDDPIKGLPLLIKATQWLAQNRRDISERLELHTFGAVKDPDAFSGLAIPRKDLGVLKGAEAVKQAYLDSDIVVSSSLYETLPGTLVEGQAYGALPVGFDRGGQSDIVEDGVTGVLCKFGTTNDESAESLALGIIRGIDLLSAQTILRMSQSVVRKFSDEVIAATYIELFRSLLD